jgi:hypothetical protein
LTLAPSIRFDVHSTAGNGSHLPPPSFHEGTPFRMSPSVSPRYVLLARTVVGQAADHPWPVRGEPSLVPTLRQVIERRHREETTFTRHAVSTLRSSELRRLETIVRQPAAPTVPQPLDGAAVGASPEPRRQRSMPSRTPVTAAAPQIAEAEVARLTDRVVQQINRRILAERERRGKA